MFQHQLHFNLVKELFKSNDDFGGVSLSEQSLRVKEFFNRGTKRKINWFVVKFCAQKIAIVFQHELLFKLVKDLFNWVIDLVGASLSEYSLWGKEFLT